MASDDLAARALDLAEKVQDNQKGIVETQKGIVAQQARSKWQIRVVALSLVFDLLITGGLIFINHQRCLQANDFRAGQIKLWDHILAVSPAPPHETAAERKARLATVASFRVYIATQFRPVTCSVLYGR